MSNELERATLALHDVDCGCPSKVHSEERWDDYRDAARAVIAAMTPAPDVLHIAGPCEDGETVTVLCGVVKEAESPKSPDQPVCQACSAVQMAERNELNYARESASDVLAEVRAYIERLRESVRPGCPEPYIDGGACGACRARWAMCDDLDAILNTEPTQ